MKIDFLFLFNSVLLGVGLAMDAFSVSLANGMNDTKMGRGCMIKIAVVFAAFQAAMPMTGWVLVHTLVEYFTAFEKLIPWIALILLCYIGIKMIRDGRCGCEEGGDCESCLTFSALILQGIATSIDALSVGFTISDYGLIAALLCAAIIAVVTFFICYFGIIIGKKFGNALAGKANIFGGCILIFIGIEIFVKGIF
ncbi:MAG: manganese efflux pump [Anaerofustis stercorihominis]|nr:manganese efflux pump [Anaerofustis stercorihominis]